MLEELKAGLITVQEFLEDATVTEILAAIEFVKSDIILDDHPIHRAEILRLLEETNASS